MSDKQDTREMLVSGNVFKTMLTLSVPAVLGMVVIGLYNFMDAVFFCQMVGPVAMTAVKVSYPFTLINSGIATLIGQGSASVLALARQLVLFLPLVVILPHLAGLGVKGVLYAQLITDLVVLLIAIILMMNAFRNMKKN